MTVWCHFLTSVQMLRWQALVLSKTIGTTLALCGHAESYGMAALVYPNSNENLDTVQSNKDGVANSHKILNGNRSIESMHKSAKVEDHGQRHELIKLHGDAPSDSYQVYNIGLSNPAHS